MTTKKDKTLQGLAALLEAHGLGVADLADFIAHQNQSVPAQSFGDWVEEQLPKLRDNTRRTYRTAIMRLVNGVPPTCECTCPECCDPKAGCRCDCRTCRGSKLSLPAFGAGPITAILASHLENAVILARRSATKRAERFNRARAERKRAAMPTHGKSAAESAVRGYRWLFAIAKRDRLVADNPAADLTAPGRSPSTRRALVTNEVGPFLDVVAAGGDDPELDLTIVWFHLETGARREGALNLRCGDLIDHRQMLRLDEKNDKERLQPVSMELLEALRALTIARAGEIADPTTDRYDPSTPVFWYRAGRGRPARPMTAKRYETLFNRVQETLPWADQLHLTAHGLRHTVGTMVERLGGTQVARRFLGHAEQNVTDGYTDATEGEVATAVAKLTGQTAVLVDGDTIRLQADTVQESRTSALEVFLIGGVPLREPVVQYGPFVMNTKEQIQEAFDDYQAGRLGRVPAGALQPHRVRR